MDSRTKAVLKYSKSEEMNYHWIEVAKALAPIYCDDLKILDVLHHMNEVLKELISESRYQINGEGVYLEIIKAPVESFHSVSFAPITKDTQFTVEEFYQSMISCMISKCRFARVGWCKEELED